MSLASPYGRGAPEGGGEGIVIFLKKITSPQAITTHFPENQKNSNIFLITLSVTPYGVPALPKGEPSCLCCKLNNNFPYKPEGYKTFSFFHFTFPRERGILYGAVYFFRGKRL